MQPWLPFVIGSVAFFYIQSYNRLAREYDASGRSLTYKDALFPRVWIN